MRVFDSMPKSVGRAQLKSGLRRSGKPALKAIQAGARGISESMASSIKIRVIPSTKVPALSIGPDPDHWWAYLWEYGTGVYGPKGKVIELQAHDPSVMSGPGLAHPIKTSKGVKATPFMRTGWDRTKEKVRANFIGDTFITIERYAKRLLKQTYSGKLSKAGKKALGI